ncbi:hypothetical protein LJ656_33835 [Paraburkholderia sp. MMS20-SJTR3]|uniref:Lipoprotein n=1 Tax=Paraburkholderia sejongensis TaxID=2886946 RepID=A0ABS8K612_9BURK|nr:hypothetical protein [Paraburkholderia sp. MMS20-SJTR3]MCC8397533.1 hypothetical protein [Paraburkholderia sp. MMS20-SJTR3]
MRQRVATLIALGALVSIAGVSGCKRADDNGQQPLSQGSSGVMSNSASARGTPGDSDAANRANAQASAAASATPAVSGAAAVHSTPASGASATQ